MRVDVHTARLVEIGCLFPFRRRHSGLVWLFMVFLSQSSFPVSFRCITITSFLRWRFQGGIQHGVFMYASATIMLHRGAHSNREH